MGDEILIGDAVETAVATAMAAPETVLTALYQAVFTYHETNDPAVMIEFAEAARLTAIVHSAPGYAKTLENAPSSPPRPGRPLDEIFAGYNTQQSLVL
jgi:hypothetical protein